MEISKSLQDDVWYMTYGDNFYGNCYCCNKHISYGEWTCSYVKPKLYGGTDVISNLRVCCNECHKLKGVQNLYSFILDYNLNGKGKEYCKDYFIKHPEEKSDCKKYSKNNLKYNCIVS